jgi:hypothetical protein
MTEASARKRSAVAAHPITSTAIAILVAVGIVGTLWVPFYARITPKVGDFPFFYFYLLIFMPFTSLLLFLATQLQRRLNGKALDGAGGQR